jgi:hypothetical protein
MARASIRTILPLDRFAAIIGLNPAHFNGAAGGSIMPSSGSCGMVIHQYDWQAVDRVSRETIARAIRDSERELASQLGFWPGPKYEVEEVYRFPKPYRRELRGSGYDIRGMPKSIKLRHAKFLQAGRRATTVIQAGSAVVRSDPDGDTYSEMATITVPTPAAVTDACEVKAYFAGKSGKPEWEIRPAIAKVFSGVNTVLTFYSWQLIKPSLWEKFPTDQGTTALDLAASANYETTVDVYREYTDFTQPSAQFFWEPSPSTFINGICSQCSGTGCTACELTTQDGCVHVRDLHGGFVVPTPASYDETNGVWTRDAWTVCREPELVKLWYQSGDQSDEFLSGETCDPMPEEWARLVAMLTVCKLERPLCSCKSVQALVQDWRTDLSRSATGGDSYYMTDEIVRNPFGTKRGQVEAWRAVFGTAERRPKVAVV